MQVNNNPDHFWQPGPNLATKSGPGSDQFWQRNVVRPNHFLSGPIFA